MLHLVYEALGAVHHRSIRALKDWAKESAAGRESAKSSQVTRLLEDLGMLLLRSWGRQLVHYEQFCAPLPRLGAAGSGNSGGHGSGGDFSPLPASAASTPRTDCSPSESSASPLGRRAGSPSAAPNFGQLPPAPPPPPLQSGAGRVGASVLSSAGGRSSAAELAPAALLSAPPRAAAVVSGGTGVWSGEGGPVAGGGACVSLGDGPCVGLGLGSGSSVAAAYGAAGVCVRVVGPGSVSVGSSVVGGV